MHDNSVGIDRSQELEMIENVRLFKHGAFDRLCLSYSAMINKILQGFDFQSADKDDLYQEGLIGLYKAAMLYNSEISSFSTFAYISIKRNIISALKKQAKIGTFTDIDEINENDLSLLEASDPEALFLSKENLDITLRRIDSVLSPYESRVLKLYLRDIPHYQIADILGKEKKSIDNALSRIRHKLRKSLIGESHQNKPV